MDGIRKYMQQLAAIVPHDADDAASNSPSEDLSLVSSLDDEFRWAEHNMNVIGDGDVDSLHAFLNEPHSRAFSGIFPATKLPKTHGTQTVKHIVVNRFHTESIQQR